MVQTYALVFLALAFVGTYAQIQYIEIYGAALKQISVGSAGVWGVDSDEQIFYRLGSSADFTSPGTGWVHVQGDLKQLDVGGNVVWGVNSKDEIWMRRGIDQLNPTGTDWVKVDGSLKHVSVSNNGNVWGVTSAGAVLYRTRDGSWVQIEGGLKQISVGYSGVWGVNANDEIYYRTGTYGDNGSRGTGWQKLEGTLKYISVAHGVVIGVNSANAIWRREGISISRPQGTHWVPLLGALSVIDAANFYTYWGVNSRNTVYLVKSSS